MRKPRAEQVTGRLLVGLDLLAFALLAVAITRPLGPGWRLWLAAAAFLACWWLIRRNPVRRAPMAVRGDGWRGGAATVLLLACYVLLLLTSDAAMWLAFPMMLLQMHVLGPARGGAAVAVTTLLTIWVGVVLRGATGPGSVLGPVIGALVAVTTVLGLESFDRALRDRQRALDELRTAQQQLAEAERDRLRAEERERLARDIHDTLAQDFAAIELHLRRAGTLMRADDPAMPAISAAQQATLDGLAQARSFVAGQSGQRPEETLPAVLRRVAARAGTDTGHRTQVDVHTTGTEQPLPAAVTTALIRLTQSALSNVTRHARATHAVLTLSWEPDRVLLDVVDDGIGFDPHRLDTDRDSRRPDGAASDGAEPQAAVGGGFGLVAMRARVDELGGTMGIESGPGEGTAIAIALPLNPPAPGATR